MEIEYEVGDYARVTCHIYIPNNHSHIAYSLSTSLFELFTGMDSPKQERRSLSRASQRTRSPSVCSDTSISDRRLENVTVAIRVRPPNREERRLNPNEVNIWDTPDPTRIRLNETYAQETRRHQFDQFYGKHQAQ
jgi:hypothetical protein